MGGGPAGSTFAARMAQLGHEVSLVEAARFPRAHLGESLSPGVLPLLEVTGARKDVECAGFTPVRNVHVKWDGEAVVREDPREQGLLVDRGHFDQLLLMRAQALGVHVRQPARVMKYARIGQRWDLEVKTANAVETISTDFIADATGRSSQNNRSRVRTGCRTVALYGYWRGAAIPREPRIEAGADEWYWGVRLPDGTYNTLVFVAVNHFRTARRATLHERFLELLGKSGIMTGMRGHKLIGPVRTCDATPWLDEECVTSNSIRVGDAALAIDPISSSGVQKAIQTALSAAIVANTLLHRPESADAAMRFYKSSLREASEHHRRWAAAHYGTVAARMKGKFWQDRAAGSLEPQDPGLPRVDIDPRTLLAKRVVLSRQLGFVEAPCLEGDFVTVKSAMRHPNLESPVAWVGPHEIAALLKRVKGPSTILELAASWSDSISLESGISVAGWLFRKGILLEE